MPTTCCIAGCRSRSVRADNVQFFSFPFKDNERVRAWRAAINRPNWIPTKNSKICSKHFIRSDYLGRPGGYVKHLKSNAVPSMNLSSTVCTQEKRMEEEVGNDSSDDTRDQISNVISNRLNKAMSKTAIVKSAGNPCTTELKETLRSSDEICIEFLSDEEYVDEDENIYFNSLKDNDAKPSYKELSQKVRMLQQEICRKNKMINSLKQILEELIK